MKIRVCFRDGTWCDSDKYHFTFHGLELEGNAFRFFSEQSPLTCTEKSGKITQTIPCGEITRIIEEEVQE